MAREPVEEAPLLPTRIETGPNSSFLVDLDRALRSICAQYGMAINDDLLVVSDFVREVSSAYTILDTDRVILVDATGGAVTVTLPAAVDAEPHVYYVMKVDAGGNAVTIQRAGADTVNGGVSVANAAQYEAKAMVSDRSSAWYVVATA